MNLADINSLDVYVEGVPHETLTHYRTSDPVHWIEEENGPGYWGVFDYEHLTSVSRDASRYSSEERTALMMEPADEIGRAHV